MLPDRGEYEHLVHHLDIEELVHHLDIEELLHHLNVGHHLDVGVAGGALSLRMSPCLANMVPKPQPTPPRNDPRKFLQAYIFPRKILNINNIRKDGIEICTGLLTEEIRA